MRVLTSGAVAQLVERSVRNAEVRGSIPLGSTTLKPAPRRRSPPPYSRSRYSPLSVLTLIFTPSSMKGGTITVMPVSICAGL